MSPRWLSPTTDPLREPELLDTPIGPTLCRFDDAGGLAAMTLDVSEDERNRHRGATLSTDAARLQAQLTEYFEGERDDFDVDLRPRGTSFQREVWEALLTIPAGRTTTYGTLAEQLGRPGSARAVGAANGANPIWLIVPCHRVIGSTGKLTGYAGGIAVKERLLRHEGVSI
ncbi:MAG: methylated-DNA--[protein]-cysteine S-methyltransferase [Acidobacteriota bacterium]